MKRTVILMLMALPLVGMAGGELLQNGGFEDAVEKYDKAGWDNRGPRGISLTRIQEPVIEGSYALRVDGRSGPKWEGVKQAVNLEAGKIYRLKGAIRLGKGEKADRGAVQLIKTLSDGTKLYQDIFRGKLTAEAYTTFEEEFSIDEGNVQEIHLSIHGMEDGKSFILDGFSLREVD